MSLGEIEANISNNQLKEERVATSREGKKGKSGGRATTVHYKPHRVSLNACITSIKNKCLKERKMGKNRINSKKVEGNSEEQKLIK